MGCDDAESIQWNWKANTTPFTMERYHTLLESIQWNWKSWYRARRVLLLSLNRIHSMELKDTSGCIVPPCELCQALNPFNGIERFRIGWMLVIGSSPSKNPFNGIERDILFMVIGEALNESIQWNWKRSSLPGALNPSSWRIHSMELKVLSPLSTNRSMYSASESIQWNWKREVHALQEIFMVENPFNGIERRHCESVEWDGVVRGIHSMELKDCLSTSLERSVASQDGESIQWNWKSTWQPRLPQL